VHALPTSPVIFSRTGPLDTCTLSAGGDWAGTRWATSPSAAQNTKGKRRDFENLIFMTL
jgi:hypothetical protein